MFPVLSTSTFGLAFVVYAAASVMFFVEVVRMRASPKPDARAADRRSRFGVAASLLGVAAVAHGAHITLMSFVVRICPVRSVHFMLSMAALFAIGIFLGARRRMHVDALGMLVSPLAMAFLLGTYFLRQPGPAPKLSPVFLTLHVTANLLGVALFLLACGAATLYLVQERKLKHKRGRFGALPPLDTLDLAVHRFLSAGFPLLTLGVVTGTVWARQLELGSRDDVLRIALGYTTWMLIAAVLLLRAAAGWRGRRAAYGTIAGFACAATVLVLYLLRPATMPLPGG